MAVTPPRLRPPLAALCVAATLALGLGALHRSGGVASVDEPAVPSVSSAARFLLARPAVTSDTPEALAAALTARGFAATAVGRAVRVAVSPEQAPGDVAARLAATRLVRHVEEDAEVRSTGTPDAPRYRVTQSAYLDPIHLPGIWSPNGGAGVVVAVVDSGVDYNHPALRTRIAYNLDDHFLDGIDDDGNGCPDDIAGCSFVSPETADPSCGTTTRAAPSWYTADDEGHGTFIAGVIAAGGPESAVAGIAPGSLILPVKVLDCTGVGRISEAAAGILYAARRGAAIINISFGTRSDSPVLREAVEAAQRAGAVVVASAGNDGRRGVTYPAAYPGVIAVAASGQRTAGGIDYTRVAAFADFGLGVTLIAPGVDLFSTIPQAVCGRVEWECAGEPYARGSGSSFATAVVSGAAALARAQLRGVDAVLVERAVRASGVTYDPAQPPLLDLSRLAAARLYGIGVPGTSNAGNAGNADERASGGPG